MPKGGARARSGPRADPLALRRGPLRADAGAGLDVDGLVHLPHAGRAGRAPAWPLPTELSGAALALWRRVWRSPQALMWERQGQHLEVALYVLRLHQSLTEPGKISLGTLVRLQQQDLGLSAPGLTANRWTVDAPAVEPAHAGPAARPAATGASSLRGRLQAVPDAADPAPDLDGPGGAS